MNKDSCGICHFKIDKKLELDGELTYATIDGKKVPVHSECLYDELGKSVEEHSIPGGAPRRG